MAMTTGRRSGQVAEINMTPMIDVLLVLLIIFMVVQLGSRGGLSVQLPPPETTAPGADPQLVLSIRPGPEYLLNARPVAAGRLTEALRGVFAGRSRKTLFVDGSGELAYRDVVAAIDASRAAGVEVVGIFPQAR